MYYSSNAFNHNSGGYNGVIATYGITSSSPHVSPKITREQKFDRITDNFATTLQPQCRETNALYNMPNNSAKNKLLRRICEIEKYEDGWHGEGSVAASKQALEETREFLSILPLGRIYEPHISLASDGEVNFFWQIEGGAVLTLGFVGDGVYSFYFKSKEGMELLKEDVPSSEMLPDTILIELERNEFTEVSLH